MSGAAWIDHGRPPQHGLLRYLLAPLVSLVDLSLALLLAAFGPGSVAGLLPLVGAPLLGLAAGVVPLVFLHGI